MNFIQIYNYIRKVFCIQYQENKHSAKMTYHKDSKSRIIKKGCNFTNCRCAGCGPNALPLPLNINTCQCKNCNCG